MSAPKPLPEYDTVVCFAHPHAEATAYVFVGPGGRLEWLPVCCNCAATHRRAGHELVTVPSRLSDSSHGDRVA